MAPRRNERSAIQSMALRLDGVIETLSCAGTQLEAQTYSVGGKAFLFVSRSDPLTLRFKVAAGKATAEALGATVGAGGWAKLVVQDGLPARLAELVAESRALFVSEPRAARPARGPKRKTGPRKRRVRD